jgi:beta-lactamase superfamily II metal-dependent hydrolase
MVYRGEAGLDIALAEGLRMEVLHPGVELATSGGVNDNSIVVWLTYGRVSLLLPGHITAEVERQPVASTVLRAAHHASCHSRTVTGQQMAAFKTNQRQ